jgi:outer membrane receptor protein involved in Fe transport
MNRALAAAVLQCLALAGAAHGLEGRVVLKEGAVPVADAEVSVLGRSGHVLSDAEGRFQLTPSPRPPFEVLVVLPGGRYARPIRVGTLSDAPLTLEVEWQIEESVTVTAGAAPSVEGGPASGVTLLAGRDLVTRMPENLAQTLENVAGASSVSEGHAAVPAVRGLSGGRTLILIDGARVTAERRVGPSATYVDPAGVLEAVEVSRGPGGVAYGSDAFGGVIQMRTRRAEPGTPYGARFEGALGAGTPQQRAALVLTKGLSRGGVLASGHYRNFDDWTSPEGEVENSGARDQGFLVRGDHMLGGGLFSAALQGDYGRDIERPRSNSQTVPFYYPEESSNRLTLGWERGVTGSLSKLGVTGFLGTYSLVTDQDRHATASSPRSIERADVSARDFHLRGYAQKPLGGARLEAGLDVNGRFDLEAHEIRVRYDASGQVAETSDFVSIEDARRTDSGLYASVEVPVGGAVSLAGGLRGDLVSTRNEGGYFGDRSTDNGAVSGFAAVTAGPFSGFSATAQVARGFRDPTLSDRYFRGPTGRGFITGNPALDPETSLQVDLALRYSSGGFRAAAYAYEYRIDDLIERYQTEADFFFFRNRGEARLRGIEGEVQAGLPAGFSVELTAHSLRGEVLDDDTGMDGIPPATVTLRLRKAFGPAWAWVRTAAYGRLDHPGPTEEERPGYALLDASAGVRLGDKAEISLLGRNLLDKAYLVSPDGRAVLAPGVSVLGSLRLQF